MATTSLRPCTTQVWSQAPTNQEGFQLLSQAHLKPQLDIAALMADRDMWKTTAGDANDLVATLTKELEAVRNDRDLCKTSLLEATTKNSILKKKLGVEQAASEEWKARACNADVFSVKLCKLDGNSTLLPGLLPTDSMNSLLTKASASLSIPLVDLNVLVGEDAFHTLQERASAPLSTWGVVQGMQLTCVRCVVGDTGAIFKVGDEVEYWSNSYQQWMKAFVERKRPQHGQDEKDSIYDLDVKRGASALRMRAAVARPRAGGA